jgi:hypothetical protein
MLGSRDKRSLSVLQKYLHHNGISQALRMRVLRNAQHALTEQARQTPEQQVELLNLVSEPLRAEIRFEIYCPFLSLHPFFRYYAKICPQVMRRVAYEAVTTSLVHAGDILFHAGEVQKTPKMIMVRSGTMLFEGVDGEEVVVNAGRWVSEATLWTSWTHRGVLSATTFCRLCFITAQTFQDIVGQFKHVDFDPKWYASEFVDFLNNLRDPPTDLCGPWQDPSSKYRLCESRNRWAASDIAQNQVSPFQLNQDWLNRTVGSLPTRIGSIISRKVAVGTSSQKKDGAFTRLTPTSEERQAFPQPNS